MLLIEQGERFRHFRVHSLDYAGSIFKFRLVNILHDLLIDNTPLLNRRNKSDNINTLFLKSYFYLKKSTLTDLNYNIVNSPEPSVLE